MGTEIKPMRLHVFIASLPLLICLHASAQPGIKDSIYSQALKEERRLQIQLPDDYKPGSNQKYQVLYLLDGEWNAELFQQAQAWSRQWGFNSPIIMVGVVNSYPNNENQRFRDLTPTSAGQKGAGGGPKLLAFLKDELIPYIPVVRCVYRCRPVPMVGSRFFDPVCPGKNEYRTGHKVPVYHGTHGERLAWHGDRLHGHAAEKRRSVHH